MSAAPCSYWYCDDATRAALAQPRPRVLLLGSYGGFTNFGDILQLKGALDWHRKKSGREPVLVCHVSAIPDAGFSARQRSWFGVQPIVYWSEQRLDLAPAGLGELTDAVPISHLHVYGGGFLNRFWGAGTVRQIEALIARFGVGHYVLSGQQIDPLFVPELREHFGRFPPRLAGGRDPESVGLLASCGVPAADSFDDAAEPLRALAARASAADRGAADLLIHLNLSYYTGVTELDRLADALATLADTARRRAEGRTPRVVLLHAYADRRTDEIIDTLGAVSVLEDRFPFLQFESIELGRHALLAGRPDAPPLGIPRAALALCSSYHVCMLLTLLDVPCHLLAANAYYEQKRGGLGGGADVADFAANPRPLLLDARFARRGAWLEQLAAAYNEPAEARAAEPPPTPTATARPWEPKRSGLEARRVQVQADGNKQREIVELRRGFEERGVYIRDLEARFGELWDESRQLGREYEARGRRITELEQELARVRTARPPETS